MSKQLPTEAITNELAGASSFFPKRQLPPHQQIQAVRQTTTEVTPRTAKPIKADAILETIKAKQAVKSTQTQTSKGHETSPYHPSTVSSDQATMPPRHHDAMPLTMIETIRKTVKQIGKEAATHRFTEEEKRKLSDLVYTYERQGYRTSENEITRIAVNWLLWDYQEQGATSMLARLLVALHE